jgi:hypothetical protein
MIDVAAWSRLGGHGHDPMNETLISSGPTCSRPGKNTWLFLTYFVGFRYGGIVLPLPPEPPYGFFVFFRAIASPLLASTTVLVESGIRQQLAIVSE